MQINESYNKNFFTIPNIQNCYWAGYLAADGYITKNNKCIRLHTVYYDKEILTNFQKQINLFFCY